MWLIDANILIYGFRPSAPQHAQAKAWLENLLVGDDSFAIPDIVWVGFVRLVTNRRTFPDPSSPQEAWAFAEPFTRAPGFLPQLDARQARSRWIDFCRDRQLTGDQIVDAWLAALALEHGLTVVTHDKDFRYFPSLKVLDPLIR
ncbi:MAG: TA system VapC family ribonuclease toxin [Opitutales bacterium]|jgi:toxin-antitoxin system PIN domain toxin